MKFAKNLPEPEAQAHHPGSPSLTPSLHATPTDRTVLQVAKGDTPADTQPRF